MENKNKRGQKASEIQKEYLIDYLEANPNLANDKFTTADGAHSRDNEWKSLSIKLNSLGGTVKDGPKWRKYWKDLTISVRSRDSAIKEQRRRSGVNGILPIKELTDIDRRIVGIISSEAVEGVSAVVSEMGFEPIIMTTINEGLADPAFLSEPLKEAERTTETLEEAIPPAPSTSKSRPQKRARRTLCHATDDAMVFFQEIEEKKLKLEERKIEIEEKKLKLMEQNYEIQLEIKKKLDALLQAVSNK